MNKSTTAIASVSEIQGRFKKGAGTAPSGAFLESAPADTQAALDYQRIEKAIVYLQSHYLDQPDLATLARAVHMSEYHFQRVFSRWAGISPKRFLQFLTLEHAKHQLAQSKPVLEAALDSGLSSPGRLHDLFVSVEAVTPGEFKTGGRGIQIEYGFHPTRFGACLLAVSFVGERGERESLSELRSHWSEAQLAEHPQATNQVANRIFSNPAWQENSLPGLLLMGTNFQIKVWRAMLKIPAGALVSYETIGGLIDAPTASRAIGAAVGANTIAYLIPCHRVIRKTGLLGGYRWGEARKRAMLGWEAARTAA